MKKDRMTKAGHHRRKRKQSVVISVDDVAVTDVEDENKSAGTPRSLAGDAVHWDDDDPRWGNPPTVGKPTIVNAKFLIAQLQDLDTGWGVKLLPPQNVPISVSVR